MPRSLSQNTFGRGTKHLIIEEEDYHTAPRPHIRRYVSDSDEDDAEEQEIREARSAIKEASRKHEMDRQRQLDEQMEDLELNQAIQMSQAEDEERQREKLVLQLEQRKQHLAVQSRWRKLKRHAAQLHKEKEEKQQLLVQSRWRKLKMHVAQLQKEKQEKEPGALFRNIMASKKDVPTSELEGLPASGRKGLKCTYEGREVTVIKAWKDGTNDIEWVDRVEPKAKEPLPDNSLSDASTSDDSTAEEDEPKKVQEQCAQCGAPDATMPRKCPKCPLNESFAVCSESCGDDYLRFHIELHAPPAVPMSVGQWDEVGTGSGGKFKVTLVKGKGTTYRAELLGITNAFYPVIFEVEGDKAFIFWSNGKQLKTEIPGAFNAQHSSIDWAPSAGTTVTWERNISGVYSASEKRSLDVVVQHEQYTVGNSALLLRFEHALRLKQESAVRHVMHEAAVRKEEMDDNALALYPRWAAEYERLLADLDTRCLYDEKGRPVSVDRTDAEEQASEIADLARSRANLARGRSIGLQTQAEQVREFVVGGGMHTLGGELGLRNIGNTCYLASAAQCLMHTVPLVEYMLAGRHFDEVNRTNRDGERGRMVAAFSELLHANFNCSNCKVLSPVQLKRAVVAKNSSFAGTAMQDSQEV
jgi:hypothetical protein